MYDWGVIENLIIIFDKIRNKINKR
jgi:hypothetical protein